MAEDRPKGNDLAISRKTDFAIPVAASGVPPP